jgi:uncharacterized protein
MSDFFAAVGLVLVIEGAAYAVFPGALKRITEAVRATSEDRLRLAGVVMTALGVLVVWLVRGGPG